MPIFCTSWFRHKLNFKFGRHTHVVDRVPKTAFIANGYRYNRDRVVITSANSRIRVTTGSGQRDRKHYGGSLELQPNAYGTYTLVNDVPIETYLRGVEAVETPQFISIL